VEDPVIVILIPTCCSACPENVRIWYHQDLQMPHCIAQQGRHWTKAAMTQQIISINPQGNIITTLRFTIVNDQH